VGLGCTRLVLIGGYQQLFGEDNRMNVDDE
jgi:hypothetical protein